jgi:hypothetical protein
MSKRKHISWKKKYACALLKLGDIPYGHAREMTADQMISLYHVDHNILHETENENVDQWWNLTPVLISAHRIKTKADAKIIAKSRRIRKWKHHEVGIPMVVSSELAEQLPSSWVRPAKIRSRGFDKTLRKKMSGKVERR